MPARISFGTDGWRGVIADDYTFENVRVCAQAFADELKSGGGGSPSCVIAYDNRFQSENFAAAVAEVMAANGLRAVLTDRATPTPTLSYTIIDRKATGGVIITASHNPAIWNGFKVRAGYGGAFQPDTLRALERRIEGVQAGGGAKRLDLEDARARGL